MLININEVRFSKVHQVIMNSNVIYILIKTKIISKIFLNKVFGFVWLFWISLNYETKNVVRINV